MLYRATANVAGLSAGELIDLDKDLVKEWKPWIEAGWLREEQDEPDSE